MVAGGMSDSTVRVWSMDDKRKLSAMLPAKELKTQTIDGEWHQLDSPL